MDIKTVDEFTLATYRIFSRHPSFRVPLVLTVLLYAIPSVIAAFEGRFALAFLIILAMALLEMVTMLLVYRYCLYLNDSWFDASKRMIAEMTTAGDEEEDQTEDTEDQWQTTSSTTKTDPTPTAD